VKIRRRVWPVGEFPKKGINKKNRYISPICPVTILANPMGGFAPNLAQLLGPPK